VKRLLLIPAALACAALLWASYLVVGLSMLEPVPAGYERECGYSFPIGAWCRTMLIEQP
jgi:hypothetical protein